MFLLQAAEGTIWFCGADENPAESWTRTRSDLVCLLDFCSLKRRRSTVQLPSKQDHVVEMAVSQRIFNSTAPFSGFPKAELKGSYPPCRGAQRDTEEEEEEEEGRDIISKWSNINKLLLHGTAEQVGEMPFKTSTIIAQAECETQDSQEFSPSCSERSFLGSPNCFTSSSSDSSEQNNVAFRAPGSVPEPGGVPGPGGVPEPGSVPGPGGVPEPGGVPGPGGIPARRSSRKKTRKRQKRKGKKKLEKQRQRHNTSSGLPEQESGRSLVQILEDSSPAARCGLSSSCCSGMDGLEDGARGLPPYGQPPGSVCCPLSWPRQASYEQSSSWDSLSTLGDCSLALAGLRGSVSQGDPCFARPFCRDLERDVREDQDRFCTAHSFSNEGIIFYNEKLQPVDSEYREGREYVLSRFIKQGSFGEVHSAQDVHTGFQFAVKKIDLKKFSSEEVGAWSTFRSPRVVKLLGVVREGPSIHLLMDQKSGSVGQLIGRRGRLPEDLSLHYHAQVAAALEYLGRKKVAHLDIKADNVLLSEDGTETFLCDFGHAERLDNEGRSLSRSRELKGTETHMAPEIVTGEPRGAKADVWSSCCMLLHMLNGCQPWTRYYSCRLYLKIANEPPPLREIPPDCGPLTAAVITAGLQKDPARRPSASRLREDSARALRGVGGLSSPVTGPYTEPRHTEPRHTEPRHTEPRHTEPRHTEPHHTEPRHTEPRHIEPRFTPTEPPDGRQLWDQHGAEDRGPTAGSADQKLDQQEALIPEPNCKRSNKTSTRPELELRQLERDFYLSSLSQLHSAEMQEQLLSCLSSDPYPTCEPWDKKDSGRWSLSLGDDFSSGVFSSNSQPDAAPLSVDLLAHTPPPPPCCFQGVDVCIRDFSRRSIRIREARRVKVGHIATGISDQISQPVFTLQTPQGRPVPHDQEVQDSGLELCCVSAPDRGLGWTWRIRDGVLETRSSR